MGTTCSVDYTLLGPDRIDGSSHVTRGAAGESAGPRKSRYLAGPELDPGTHKAYMYHSKDKVLRSNASISGTACTCAEDTDAKHWNHRKIILPGFVTLKRRDNEIVGQKEK